MRSDMQNELHIFPLVKGNFGFRFPRQYNETCFISGETSIIFKGLNVSCAFYVLAYCTSVVLTNCWSGLHSSDGRVFDWKTEDPEFESQSSTTEAQKIVL
ncbi:hypothetical protein M0804_008819 [Polistes exclamans]|nr:hypothetical protein M0804_008819 [Polistes exclamans]